MGALSNRRIVVTRDEPDDGTLCALFRDAGAVPLLQPTVEVAPLHDAVARRALLPDPAEVRWLVLTSPRTVALLAEAGWFAAPPPATLRTAVVGPRTEEALSGVGWSAAVRPDRAGAGPLVEEIRRQDGSPGGTVLHPVSARADARVPEGLEAAGYHVVRVDLYAPRPRALDAEWWSSHLVPGPTCLAALTFTSPSAVDGLAGQLDPGPILDRLRSLPAGVQGPTTAAAAARAGWGRLVEANPRTFAGLVGALERYFAGSDSHVQGARA